MHKLSELLDEGHVLLDLRVPDVPALLQTLATELTQHERLPAAAAGELARALLERERLGGTCVGHGVAVPHAYLDTVGRPALIFARLEHTIDYGSPADGRGFDLVFMLSGPKAAQLDHIAVIARIVRLLHDADWLAALRGAMTAEDVVAAVKAVEQRHV